VWAWARAPSILLPQFWDERDGGGAVSGVMIVGVGKNIHAFAGDLATVLDPCLHFAAAVNDGFVPDSNSL
jgi:hypothetical protein